MQRKVKASHRIDMHSGHHILPQGNPYGRNPQQPFLRRIFHNKNKYIMTMNINMTKP